MELKNVAGLQPSDSTIRFDGSENRGETDADISRPSHPLAWALLDASPDGIVITRRDGRIGLVNRSIEEMFGYSRGELLGCPIEVLLPLDQRQVHGAHRLRYVAAPHARPMGQDLDLWGRRADGAEFPVEVSLSPCTTDDGEVFIAAVRDVSARRAAEQQVHNTLRLLDGLTEAVYVCDADTLAFTHVNQGAVNQTGYSVAELLTMTPMHIAPAITEERAREILATLAEGKNDAVLLATVVRDRHGVDHPVECHVDLPPAGKGQSAQIVVVARDISERLAQDAKLREAHEMVAIVADRERIARDLHDTVIQDLFGTALALQGSAMRADGELRVRMLEMVDRLDRVIKEIRTTIFAMTAQRDGTGTVRDRVLAVVDESSRILGFRPVLRVDGPVDLSTPDDVADQLVPVLREALANVARHAHASRVEIDLVHVDGSLSMRVADNGVGMPSERDGAGNGLRNLEGRAGELGGTFRVEANEGQGMVACWTVPVQ